MALHIELIQLINKMMMLDTIEAQMILSVLISDSGDELMLAINCARGIN